MRRIPSLPLIAVALSLAVSACSKDAGGGAGGPPGGMPPTQVESVRVQPQSLPNQFETVGTLRADESVIARPFFED